MLLGQDIGQDFFPKEIATYTCGLKISEHRIKLFDMNRYIGFSGSFPAHFVTMYSLDDHPKTLLLQECPQQLNPIQDGLSANLFGTGVMSPNFNQVLVPKIRLK